MLKAVRFDEDKHGDLLNFINEYTDSKGRKNESEAIRFLMQVGYDYLHNTTHEESLHVPLEKKDTHNNIDMESLKKEVLNEVLSQLNAQTFNNLNAIVDKLSNIQPVYIQQPNNIQNVQENDELTKINATPKQKQIEIPADTNPLLANLLANANR